MKAAGQQSSGAAGQEGAGAPAHRTWPVRDRDTPGRKRLPVKPTEPGLCWLTMQIKTACQDNFLRNLENKRGGDSLGLNNWQTTGSSAPTEC